MKKQTVAEILRWHTWTPNNETYDGKPDPDRCRDHNTYGVSFHQCLRGPVVFCRGLGFCNQHANRIQSEINCYGLKQPVWRSKR